MTENLGVRQKEFFHSGRTRSYAFRKEQLFRLGNTIESKEENILRALESDLKRPAREVYASEIAFILAEIKHTIKNLHRWMEPEKVKTPLVAFPGRSQVLPEPYGCCGIFAPWNYPFQLSLSPLIGALAAGNCAILKPSEIAPASSEVITAMINDNFDPSYLASFPGGKEEAQTLLHFPLDFIFFTGSSKVGSLVMQQAAQQLIPVVLELGGKSPCVVTEDVPLEVTVRRILWGKFLNAGQTCIAPDYLLIPSGMVEDFLTISRKVLSEFYGENPQESPDYGRIINQKHLERLIHVSSGLPCVVGGQVDREDLYIAPSVYYPVHWHNAIMQEEIFGPLLPVLTYESLSEVVERLKRRASPLALYLFSTSRQNIQFLTQNISAGSVCINDTLLQVTSHHLPFGGTGKSGMGKYHGWYSFNAFSHYKSILRRSFKPDWSFRYPPATMPLSRFKKLLRFLF